MARRKLSTGGRIVAAGMSVGVAAGLVGAMAAGDHTAHATQSTTATDGGGSTSGAAATPYDPSRNGDGGTTFGGGSSTPVVPAAPQAHTRSGGS